MKRLPILAFLCASMGLPSALAQAPEPIRVAWVKAIVAAPLMIAKEKGYFRQAGLDVETELASGSANLMPMLATGRLHVLEGGVQGNIFGAIAQGLPLSLIHI